MTKIRTRISTALQDEQLQKNLKRNLENSHRSRTQAVMEVENWEALREHARQVKLHTLARLEGYLRQFEEKVQESGGKVIWAESAGEAVKFVLELARKRGIQRVVKSKTMLGEEIELNQQLAESGADVVETDLGEYIVQLSDEPPFHIVTPALHKSKEEVAKLFEERLGIPATDDITQLTETARNALRHRFVEAQMGISGVNFGIAETGTIVVVENEGNARLSVSVPSVHVALMGIEKVIPRACDLPVFLKLLTRSATGQRITSYVNLLTGPRRPGEPDGPEEFFLVLVDNGRSQMLRDPVRRQTLSCIRCGACLNVCPVFQQIGGHSYGSVYQGPIGAILMPQLVSLGEFAEHPFLSSLCGACQEVCPVKIEIPRILLHLRKEVQEKTKGSIKIERMGMALWAWIFSSPRRFRWFSKLLRLSAPLLGRKGKPLVAPPPLSVWLKSRNLPAVPKRSFRRIMEEEL